MSPYMKRFVLASLLYLALAALIGIANGIFDVTYFGLFAHTHFSLLGFMAMIVFGIGYFILPRFNGTSLRFPGWVPVHFWLANVSLIGMVMFRSLSVETGRGIYTALFIVTAVIQAVSILMFVVNMWVTLTPSKKVTASGSAGGDAHKTNSPPGKPTLRITADTGIAEMLEAAPQTKEVLIRAGLKSLAIPSHLEQVRSMGITLAMAAARHRIDLDSLIKQLRQVLDSATSAGAGTATPAPLSPKAQNDTLSSELLIGDVMKKYPGSREVFQKYFGDGCFDCPGQMYESIDMACRMHGVDRERFLQELESRVAV